MIDIIEVDMKTWLADMGFEPGDVIKVTGPASYTLERPQ